MRRQPSNRATMVTPRDLQILQALCRYRYLRSSHFYPLIGGKSRRRFIERLGVLYHEAGYIERPARQWQALNARYMPAIYELSAAGELVLREHGLASESNPLLHRGKGMGFLFQHELMVCDILASIEIGIRERPELRFISGQEILANAPRATQQARAPFDIPVSISHRFARSVETCNKALAPDALFGIEYPRGEKRNVRFFALEADRDNEPVTRNNLEQTSFLRKLLQYQRVLASKTYQSHLGLPNLHVLTVTTSEGNQKRIMELLSELTDGKGHAFMLFRTMPSLASHGHAPPPTPFILDTPWQRAGHPDFYIDRL